MRAKGTRCIQVLDFNVMNSSIAIGFSLTLKMDLIDCQNIYCVWAELDVEKYFIMFAN